MLAASSDALQRYIQGRAGVCMDTGMTILLRVPSTDQTTECCECNTISTFFAFLFFYLLSGTVYWYRRFS